MKPILGVFFHWLGGLASGSFYVPYKAVRKWSWEVYWLVGGFFSWIIVSWVLSLLLTNDTLGVLKQQEFRTLAWAYLFRAIWGLSGLTFGLTKIRTIRVMFTNSNQSLCGYCYFLRY